MRRFISIRVSQLVAWSRLPSRCHACIFSTSRACSSSNSSTGDDSPSGESTDAWVKRQMDASVMSKYQTAASAQYFADMLKEVPDLSKCVKEAQRLMGGNEPEALTRFQQSRYADQLSAFSSRIASEQMMATRREESAAKRFTQDGTPTGEAYWMEAGNILASPSVPSVVKDGVLKDLQKDRNKSSPAFAQPPDTPGGEDYAEHLRRQKRRLLDGSDTLF